MKGKNVLVTGASRGLGRALCKELVAKGHQVLAVSRNESALHLLKEEINCAILPFDLVKITDNQTADSFRQAVANFGPLDVLINNAGQLGKEAFSAYSIHQAKEVFEINFFAPAFLIQQLDTCFRPNAAVHIVSIASMGGFQGSKKFPGLSFYSASKAALCTLSEVLAEEFSGRQRYFNTLCLGSVQTEMLEEAFPGYQAQTKPAEMAAWIAEFALEGYRFFNGKTLPVAGLDV